jgi:class 3 adenylate cyclase
MHEAANSLRSLIETLQTKRDEVRRTGEAIRRSVSRAAVAFIDLSNSTAMKSEMDPDIWLGRTYAFLQLVERSAKEQDGTVVKRIGDEVLATFAAPAAAEQFVAVLHALPDLAEFRFKVALDYGDVYLIRFEEHLPLDPYGAVVDRCARIARMAGPGSTLCSGAYEAEVHSEGGYYRLGEFHLSGLPKLEPVYVRLAGQHVDQHAYLDSLLSRLNAYEMQRSGFQFLSRRFSVEDFRATPGRKGGHPFLLRELMTLPHLPYSLTQFSEILGAIKNDRDRLDFVGHLVIWEAKYCSYSLAGADAINVFCLEKLAAGVGRHSQIIVLLLPSTMADVVKRLQPDTPLQITGVLMHPGRERDYLTLDYVHLQLPE